MSEDCSLCPGYAGKIPTIMHWIQCSICSSWYHIHCLHLLNSEVSKISSYHCFKCSVKHGPSVYKRTSSRKRRHIDYVALDMGDVESMTLDQHPHVLEFQHWENDDEVVDELNGFELCDYAKRTRLPKPVKIPYEKRKGLGLVVPPGFSVDAVVDSLGEDHPIEIMDVLTQNGIKGSWTVGGWRDYFQSVPSERPRILNVLSLEISDSSIGRAIKRPTYVDEQDLVDKVWPGALDDSKPMVQKYCLMGVANSYTDFHLDFAGTSVYYTVVYGAKQFMFFPPTKLNLRKYTTWITDSNKHKQFLGSLGLEQGIKVSLTTGDSLIIPSGWIHAVYTPIDTVVIGGNFLTSFNIKEQFQVIDVEIATKVDKKFRFPQFGKLMWLLADSIMRGDLGVDDESKTELFKYLELQCSLMKNGSPKVRKSIREDIPAEYLGMKPLEFLKKFEDTITTN